MHGCSATYGIAPFGALLALMSLVGLGGCSGAPLPGAGHDPNSDGSTAGLGTCPLDEIRCEGNPDDGMLCWCDRGTPRGSALWRCGSKSEHGVDDCVRVKTKDAGPASDGRTRDASVPPPDARVKTKDAGPASDGHTRDASVPPPDASADTGVCVENAKVNFTFKSVDTYQPLGADHVVVVMYDPVRDPGRVKECVWLEGVTTPGWYKLYDKDIAESCLKQVDETFFVTVKNSCNTRGFAQQTNTNRGDYFVVMDTDNLQPFPCAGDYQCSADRQCRDGTNGGKCCVPRQPTFIGTFWLEPGNKKNRLCVHHWCPVYKSNPQLGFVTGNCEGRPDRPSLPYDRINSVHLKLGADFVACPDGNPTVSPCAGL